MAEKKKKYLKIAVLAVAVGIGIFYWKYVRHFSYAGYLEQKLYALPQDITAKELEQKGYLNVTNVLEGESKKITKFLRNAKMRSHAVLKTFWVKEDDIYAKVYYSDPKLKRIRSFTYLVKRRGGENPDGHYDGSFEAISDDGIVTVKLKHARQDSEITSINEVLYRYDKN